MYVAVSPSLRVPEPDCWLDPEKNGPFVRVNSTPFASDSISFNEILDRVTFPVFSTVILYWIISPIP